MTRTNKTVSNLSDILDRLDNACGEVDNSLVALASMTNLPQDILNTMERFDFSALVDLKNQVEILLDSKKQ